MQLFVSALAFEAGVSAGWTLYFPLTGVDFSSSDALSIAILSLHLLGLSSEAGAVTFLATLVLARMSGLSSVALDLVSWAIAIVSVLLLTSLPILGAGITVLAFERHFGFVGLNGASFWSTSDPVAFQHLFWFFGHPEVYVIILPAFGNCLDHA